MTDKERVAELEGFLRNALPQIDLALGRMPANAATCRAIIGAVADDIRAKLAEVNHGEDDRT